MCLSSFPTVIQSTFPRGFANCIRPAVVSCNLPPASSVNWAHQPTHLLGRLFIAHFSWIVHWADWSLHPKLCSAELWLDPPILSHWIGRSKVSSLFLSRLDPNQVALIAEVLRRSVSKRERDRGSQWWIAMNSLIFAYSHPLLPIFGLFSCHYTCVT